jgi:hypothetical protein
MRAGDLRHAVLVPRLLVPVQREVEPPAVVAVGKGRRVVGNRVIAPPSPMISVSPCIDIDCHDPTRLSSAASGSVLMWASLVWYRFPSANSGLVIR